MLQKYDTNYANLYESMEWNMEENCSIYGMGNGMEDF